MYQLNDYTMVLWDLMLRMEMDHHHRHNRHLIKLKDKFYSEIKNEKLTEVLWHMLDPMLMHHHEHVESLNPHDEVSKHIKN
jgi:hypothetical protein